LKKRAFTKEKLIWPAGVTNGMLPEKFSSVQTHGGAIFTVGGLVGGKPYAGMLKIENNFKVTEMPGMGHERFNVPLAFVQERFICALCGLLQPNNPSLTCEGYDIVKSIWFKMRSIEAPRYSTTAVVMNN